MLGRFVRTVEKPAAVVLVVGAFVVFVGVTIDFFAVGNARLATLLVSADLLVSGASALFASTEVEDG